MAISDNVMKNFNEACDSLFTKITPNVMQTRNLESIRDTLLPKLMSGEIRVKN